MAYINVSNKGSIGISFIFVDSQGCEFKPTVYVTSGTEKGCKNYYITGKGEKKYLPAYEIVNQICKLVADKDLSDIKTEEKIINTYNFDTKKMEATEKEVLTELLGEEIQLGVLEVLKDKYNDESKSTSVNEIDKVFNKQGFTLVEVQANATEAVKVVTWKKRNDSTVKDIRNKSKNSNNNAFNTKPSEGQVPTFKKSLFE
jgi:hypothetical protein